MVSAGLVVLFSAHSVGGKFFNAGASVVGRVRNVLAGTALGHGKFCSGFCRDGLCVQWHHPVLPALGKLHRIARVAPVGRRLRHRSMAKWRSLAAAGGNHQRPADIDRHTGNHPVKLGFPGRGLDRRMVFRRNQSLAFVAPDRLGGPARGGNHDGSNAAILRFAGAFAAKYRRHRGHHLVHAGLGLGQPAGPLVSQLPVAARALVSDRTGVSRVVLSGRGCAGPRHRRRVVDTQTPGLCDCRDGLVLLDHGAWAQRIPLRANQKHFPAYRHRAFPGKVHHPHGVFCATAGGVGHRTHSNAAG